MGNVKQVIGEVEDWLKAIDKSGLPGKFKVWCYQHGIVPRLQWPLVIYDFPASEADIIERKV